MKKITQYLWIILAIFNFHEIFSKSIDQDIKLWNRLNITGTLLEEPNIQYLIETHLRYSIGNNPRFNQYLQNMALGHGITKNTTFWLGYSYVINNFTQTHYERRSWQQLTSAFYTSPWISLASRTRFEQRWRNDTQGVALRIRQLIALTFETGCECVNA